MNRIYKTIFLFFFLIFSFYSEIFAVDNEVITSFHQVNSTIYRSARPEEKDFYQFVQKGVKTILNLEGKFSEKESSLAKKYGLIYIWIPMHPIFTPKKNDLDEIITILKNPNYQPILVHCKKGKDRTGLVIAAYRIKVEDWKFEEAYKEMKKYGFNRYLFWWKKFLLDYTRKK